MSALRVLVTRAEGDAAPLAAALWKHGLEPLLLPLLGFERAAEPNEVIRAIEELEEGWIALTSPRAAGSLEGIGPLTPKTPVAAIGPTTKAALEARGVSVALVGTGQGARGLLRALEDLDEVGTPRLLWLRGDRARREIFEIELQARGFDVRSLIVYRTVLREIEPQELDLVKDFDAYCAASPSAVEALVAALGRAEPELAASIRERPAIAIGATTADALERLGFRNVSVASMPTADALAEATLNALQEGLR